MGIMRTIVIGCTNPDTAPFAWGGMAIAIFILLCAFGDAKARAWMREARIDVDKQAMMRMEEKELFNGRN